MITRTVVLIVTIAVLSAAPASAGLLGMPMNLKFTLDSAIAASDSKGQPADLSPSFTRDSVEGSYTIWC